MQKSASLSSSMPLPWWVALAQDDQINSSTLDWIGEHHKSDLNLSAPSTKEKHSVFHLAFSPGENKKSLKESNVHDHQTNNFQQFSPSQQKNYFELGLGQPMIYANYPLVDQCHGLFALYGTQPTATGRVMLPFSVTTEDGPIYVNPKQYHGILRRRKMRAKEGMKNRSARDKVPLLDSQALLTYLPFSHAY